jgi:hypothetical protein
MLLCLVFTGCGMNNEMHTNMQKWYAKYKDNEEFMKIFNEAADDVSFTEFEYYYIERWVKIQEIKDE